ncbi:class I SAM-dependent methyltransferase [Mesorhizobium sp. M0029]|uniref:class I SAM-dependent methyltransferase n=1 Tax=Mesorhizobium sp. M0029 TaxID=2956850 RepID=UPI003338C4F7
MNEGQEKKDELFLAAYNQNAEHFRSLNTLMWQVPLIAMTLTGGLWYGVSTSQSSMFTQACLLALAAAGNFGLLIALSRIRFIMGGYLKWFEAAYPNGFVKAEGDGKLCGDGLFSGRTVVKRVFQWVLGGAAAVSLLQLFVTGIQVYASKSQAVAYYDSRAEELADAYESMPFERAHPELADALRASAPLDILDIGAGSGRDAAWMAVEGNTVVAVEPSSGMLKLAQRLHDSEKISWLQDRLPTLARVQQRKYDLVILSAVWMHLPSADRAAAIRRMLELLKDDGLLYVTLRLGPTDPKRGIYAVSFEELKDLAAGAGLTTSSISEAADLLSRPDVRWQRVVLFKDGQPHKLLIGS